ncbi:Cytochrome p450 [Mycena sanguinolenta]|uniref:Cytochrome p450 n=1 Tax=Mycena sanguinolenta TaxID=230812 RepID=A0A8H6YWE8_9AGAR|nr:Cytochrome p450 [Mycena sanguinolenta]
MGGMVILATAYGIDVLQEDDPYMAISEKAADAINRTTTRGSFLLDSLPSCVLCAFISYTNHLAILHDEATYSPHPDQFIPERWLTKDGKINSEMRDAGVTWGFRKMCVLAGTWHNGRCGSAWPRFSRPSTSAKACREIYFGARVAPVVDWGELVLTWVDSYLVPRRCDTLLRSKAA